jgi:hypothetical protein
MGVEIGVVMAGWFEGGCLGISWLKCFKGVTVFETMIGERMYLLPRKKSLNEGPALANSREEGKVCGMCVA